MTREAAVFTQLLMSYLNHMPGCAVQDIEVNQLLVTHNMIPDTTFLVRVGKVVPIEDDKEPPA